MFYGCTNLKTTYAQDQLVKADDDYKDAKVTSISALPKTDFTKGDTYHADDFSFSSNYDDDGQQELDDVTDDDVTFTPETAKAAGKQKVTISFKDTGKYKGYDPIETTVNVIDPEDGKVSLETDKHININLECNDLLQKYTIHFIKTDEKGNFLPGATFALKAACEIVDKNGKTIFNKGDTITTTAFMQTSDNSDAVTEDKQEEGTYTLGAVATEQITSDDSSDSSSSKTSRLTVISSESMINSQITDTYTTLENLDLFMNAVTANFDKTKNIAIKAKSLEVSNNTMQHAGIISILTIFGIPLVILIYGFMRWWKRRKV